MIHWTSLVLVLVLVLALVLVIAAFGRAGIIIVKGGGDSIFVEVE